MQLSRLNPKMGLIAALFLASLNLHASSLEEFYKYFKNGQYSLAIEVLNTTDTTGSSPGLKSYLSGLSLSRMQEYDQAATQFEAAIKLNNDSTDLYYEYGQALYAANELKKAREAFKLSVQKKFNVSASLYYVAHISQILENFEIARDYYTMVLKEKSSDNKMKQIARFQLGETLLSIAREKSAKSRDSEDLRRRVEKFILPMMTSAYNIDKSTNLASDVTKRIGELMQEFNLDPDMLVNARRVSPKRYSGYFSQKVKFDNNISLISEENNVQQSKKESFVFESEVYGKYDFILEKRYVISPEVRLNFLKHADQSSPEVYQNDSFTMNFNLRNKYEHKFKERPASLLFDIDYSNISKDWKAQKKREFYASSTTFTLGESFSYFNIGDTTLKIKRKNYAGENEAISNHTTSLTADQTFFFENQHLLVFLFDASFIDNYNNVSSNSDSYLARFDYIMPEVMPQYTLDLAFAVTMTDTLEQKSVRGTEFSWNPSIDFSRELSASSKISVNYDFTKNQSKDSNYSYTKHVFTTEYRFSF